MKIENDKVWALICENFQPQNNFELIIRLI